MIILKQKHLVLTLFSLFLFIAGFGQTKPIDPNKAAGRIEKELDLPTAKSVGKKYLEGSYTFIVELDGSISNVEVKDSIGHGIDEQVVFHLSQSRSWKVVEIGGKAQRISYKLPIRLKLPKK